MLQRVRKTKLAKFIKNHQLGKNSDKKNIDTCGFATKQIAYTSGRSLMMANGGKFTSAISGKEIWLPKFGSMTSTQATKWLKQIQPEMKAYTNKLIEANHPNASWEEKAIIAINIRNAFVNVARQGIADVKVILKLENNRPLWDYKTREKALATDKDNPLSGEALNKKLYDEAFDVE